MKRNTIFLNSKEHIYKLSNTDTLMLRNYALQKKLKYCSMIGGPASIRDIKKAFLNRSNSLDFPMVESIFSLMKIISSIEYIYRHDAKLAKELTVFLNICTLKGLDIVDQINLLTIPNPFPSCNIVFNINIQAISQEYSTNKLISLLEIKFRNLRKFSFSSSISIEEDYSLVDKIKSEIDLHFVKYGFLYIYINDMNFKDIKATLERANILNNELSKLIKRISLPHN